MAALPPIGPRKVRELLRQNGASVIVPFSVLDPGTEEPAKGSASGNAGGNASGNAGGTLRVVAAGADTVGASSTGASSTGVKETPGVSLPAGEVGLARVLGDALAGVGAEGVLVADRMYQVTMPAEIVGWIADRGLLWHTLAGAQGAGPVEVGAVDSEALAHAVGTGSAAGPGSGGESHRVWQCRAGDVSWIVVEHGDDQEGRGLARSLHRLRDTLRALGLRGIEVDMRRRPPSVVNPGMRLVRLATPEWVGYWPAAALNRLLQRIVPGAGGAVSAQRGAALRLCDQLIRAGGIGALIVTLPRTAEERRGRYAVRTVLELVRAGGIVPRAFVETAFRSGAHYRALATVTAGLSRVDRATVRQALGRRRWEVLADRMQQGTVAPRPWVAFVVACETLVRDLADRARRPGYSPPAAVNEIVRRYFTDPREERLRAVWRKQVESGVLVRALEAARLSRLRSILRQLPRETLVFAGCGDTRDAQMRISAIYSRRGRRMYLEDVASVEARIDRRELLEWDTLLAARMTVHAAAVHAAAVHAAADRPVSRGMRGDAAVNRARGR